MLLEKIMQKAMTAVNSSQGDCFAYDAAEGAEETDTPLPSVSIGGRTRSNDDIDWPVHSLMLSSTIYAVYLCDEFRPCSPAI